MHIGTRFCIPPEAEACINCGHYHQYYDKYGCAVYYGHCAYPRMKLRRPGDSCEHFEQKEQPNITAHERRRKHDT